MTHQLLVFITFFLVIFFALLNIHVPLSHSPTGAVVNDDASDTTNHAYALALDGVVSAFFNTQTIAFPQGDCGDVARDLYNTIAFTSVDTSSGFVTRGPDRVATLNFVTDRTARYGTLDLVNGPSLIGDEGTTSFLSINTETIVRVPKEVRTTYFSLDLYGTTNTQFHVTRGKFSTPSLDCSFVSTGDIALCNCKAHSITGIRVAGITGVRAV